ncbi:hypothetical protein F4680DRAFT_470624 [Xylaria scruposa]|nr:hypothetical protein F4680DRAFT_470624 [Xylaria scruposa]
MASLQSPISPSTQPPTSTGAPKSQRSPRKLRDSCHNCAVSKLRCGKEKPTCARCMRQGKTCGYVPSKRAGRTHGQRSDAKGTENAGSPVPARQVESSSESSLGAAPVTISPDSIHVSLTQHSTSFQDMFPSPFSYTEESTLFSPSIFTPQFLEMDTMGFAIPCSIFEPIGTTSNSQADTVIAHAFNDSSLLQQSIFQTLKSNPSIPENTLLETSVVQDAALPSVTEASDAGPEFPLTPTELSLESQCSCLSRAFDLFKRLSLGFSENAGPLSKSEQVAQQRQNDQDAATRRETGEIKKHVKTILGMAECSCSEDPYFVHLMCLLIFRIMDLYKSAIRRSDAREEHKPGQEMAKAPANTKATGADDDDKIRITAQLYFGELHLVQRLIGILSSRLQRFGGQQNGEQSLLMGNSATYDNTDLEFREKSVHSPLPLTLSRQLEVDLRRRLRALSGEIVDVIRDG